MPTLGSASTSRRGSSRVLHGIDRLASRSFFAVAVVAVDLVWIIVSFAVGFPSRSEAIFQTLVAALTLAMVFVIQHTQAREQLATQRKLDEILRALPEANNGLIAFEDASDADLASTHREHRELRDEAVDSPAPAAPPEVLPAPD